MDDTTHTSPVDDKQDQFQFTTRHILAAFSALSVVLALWVAMPLSGGAFASCFLPMLVWLYFVYREAWLRFSPLAVFALVLGAGLLVTVLLPDFSSLRVEKRLYCKHNIRSIAMALRAYEADYRSFPPAYVADENGQPIHSWRVLILPYLEEDGTYALYDFSEPWDGPNNSRLHSLMPGEFRCPSSRGGRNAMTTSYLAIVGPGTAWPDAKAVRLSDIKDGAADTLLLVEVANSKVHWMEPRDLQADHLEQGINSDSGRGINSSHDRGANAATADGRAHFLTERLSDDDLKALSTIDGGESVPIF